MIVSTLGLSATQQPVVRDNNANLDMSQKLFLKLKKKKKRTRNRYVKYNTVYDKIELNVELKTRF